MKDAKDVLEELADGLAVSVHFDEGAAVTLAGIIMGHSGRLPLRVIIDPGASAFPDEQCTFVGGTHDGKQYRLDDEQRKRKTITLEGGETYLWDGYQFMFDGKGECNPEE